MSEESDGEVLAAQENAGESDLPNVEEEKVVVQQLPDYLFSRMRKNELRPPFWWATKEPPINVRTPATNMIQGGLPGLTRVSRALGYSPKKVDVWNLLFDKDMVEVIVVHTY